MGKYISIKDTAIYGSTYLVQQYLSNHNYFNSDRFKRTNDTCIRSVASVIEQNKELLEKIIREYRMNGWSNNAHALRLLIYNDASVASMIGRLQTHGKSLYASYIKEEIGQAIDDDYMKMPEYVRNAIPKERMVNEIVGNFLHENEKNIRKAVSDMVYGNLRKLIDKELF